MASPTLTAEQLAHWDAHPKHIASRIVTVRLPDSDGASYAVASALYAIFEGATPAAVRVYPPRVVDETSGEPIVLSPPALLTVACQLDAATREQFGRVISPENAHG